MSCGPDITSRTPYRNVVSLPQHLLLALNGPVLRVAVLLLFCFCMASCSARIPTWQSRTAPLVEALGKSEAPTLYPQEYQSVLEAFEHGEALYRVQEDQEKADEYFHLAFQKGNVLRAELNTVREQREAHEQRLAAERAAKLEEEQQLRREAETRLKQSHEVTRSDTARPTPKKQKDTPAALPTTYTVRRGETLPQISARVEVYNDSSLWPLIYRANRDQIRDPKRLWPGQVFAIPRNFSREEAVEARRYSNKNN